MRQCQEQSTWLRGSGDRQPQRNIQLSLSPSGPQCTVQPAPSAAMGQDERAPASIAFVRFEKSNAHC